jgi:hypothetical protein
VRLAAGIGWLRLVIVWCCEATAARALRCTTIMMHQSLDPGENRHCEAGDSGNSESSVEATSPTHQVSMPWVRWVVMAQISGCSLGAFCLGCCTECLHASQPPRGGRTGVGAGSAGVVKSRPRI